MSITISTTRETLALDLRTFGEDALAVRVATLDEDQMRRIGELAGDISTKGEPLLAKALALAAVWVIEGAPRELRWKRRRLKGIWPGT